MSNTALKDIRLGVVNLLKLIKGSPDYTTNLPDNNIKASFSSAFLQMRLDANYPKAFVVIDEGASAELPSARNLKSVVYQIIFVHKQFTPQDTLATEKVEAFVDDLDKVIVQNDTLFGRARNVKLLAFLLDGGYSEPEGVGVFKVQVDYERRY